MRVFGYGIIYWRIVRVLWVWDNSLAECESALVWDNLLADCESALVWNNLLSDCESAWVWDNLLSDCENSLYMKKSLLYKLFLVPICMVEGKKFHIRLKSPLFHWKMNRIRLKHT